MMNSSTLAESIRTEIAGIPVAVLASQYGTPSYIYDAARIRSQIEALRQFDTIRYAQKANSNLAILDLMRREGVVVDAVSVGEMHRARTAGFELDASSDEVVYTADIFDRETLDYVAEHNVHVNCGSPDMIRQYGERVPGRDITLRINPGFGHGHTRKTNTGGEQSKHGIWHEQIDQCLTLASEYRLNVTGLHMHIGSGTDFEHLSQVCDAMDRFARRVGKSLQTISAGGGLPTPYQAGDETVDLTRYFTLWDKTRKGLAAEFGHPLRLEIEPGRFLVAESGFLIAEIRAVKTMGQNTFYLVDAGFNNLARPIMYGSYHPISICPREERSPGPTQPVVVGGPLCESGDIFTQEEGGYVASRDLPAAHVGDWVLIECAGAYGAVMGSNYNSKPLAAEVLVDGHTSHLIRARQSLDELIAGERIPG